MARSLTFYFYRAAVDGSDLSFEEALTHTLRLDPKSRVKADGAAHVMLHRFKDSKGNVVRIRMSRLPARASLAGKLDELQLAGNEGLGEETGFYFDPSTRIVAIQSTKIGVSAAMFCRYMNVVVAPRALGLSLTPVPDFASIDQLSEIERFTNFELALAGTDRPVEIPGLPEPIEAILEAQRAVKAPQIELRFTTSRNWRSEQLDAGIVRKAIRAIYKAVGRVEVKRLQVDGRTTDEEAMMIDLMRGRLWAGVSVDDDRRRLPPSVLRQAAADAWAQHADKLRQTYGEESEVQSRPGA